MPQGFKNKKASGGKAHSSRKNASKKSKQKSRFDKNNKKVTSNINKNIEEIMVGRASEAKIRLKIAGRSKAIKK